MHFWGPFGGLVVAGILVACTGSGGEVTDISLDVDVAADTLLDERGEDPVTDTFEDLTQEFQGFQIRVPQERSADCGSVPEGVDSVLTLLDADWLCTFEYDGESGFVYVQNNLSECVVLYGPMPVFETVGAWISFDGVATPMEAGYDSGGNHQNDYIEFDWDELHFRYFHSSFDFGWRKCQPMDCLEVYGADGFEQVEDGCTNNRTLPVVCRAIPAGGGIPDLTDTFELCLGNNYGE